MGISVVDSTSLSTTGGRAVLKLPAPPLRPRPQSSEPPRRRQKKREEEEEDDPRGLLTTIIAALIKSSDINLNNFDLQRALRRAFVSKGRYEVVKL